MKNFKKQFPSLEGKDIKTNEICCDRISDESPLGAFWNVDIYKHCLDKSRVRDALEVIKSIANMIPDDLLCKAGRNEKRYLKKTLHATIDLKKKELGLEE